MDKKIFLSILMLLPLCAGILHAAEDKTKNASTQQVGGLLFDVDEGVKVEQGPGGSVYLKSNRDYMQEKFKAIDAKLEEFGKRIAVLEASAKTKTEKSSQDSGKKVLVT